VRDFQFKRTSKLSLANTHRWTPNPVSDEQAFEAIKAGVDALPAGTKAFRNSDVYDIIYPRSTLINLLSGEFYAMDRGTANL
jgi:pyridoxine 4-dehydrogenase